MAEFLVFQRLWVVLRFRVRLLELFLYLHTSLLVLICADTHACSLIYSFFQSLTHPLCHSLMLSLIITIIIPSTVSLKHSLTLATYLLITDIIVFISLYSLIDWINFFLIQEEKKILFYYPHSVAIDTKIKHIGLCEAIIKFTSYVLQFWVV